jgi:hypothetical protein
MYDSGVKFGDDVSMARVLGVHGMVSMGMTPLKLAPSNGELHQGYIVLREALVYFWRVYQSKEFMDNIANHRAFGLCAANSLCFWLCDIWTKPPTDEERVMWSRKELLQLAEDYDYGKGTLNV